MFKSGQHCTFHLVEKFQVTVEGGRPRSKAGVCRLWSWAGILTSLSSSFLTGKPGMIIALLHKVDERLNEMRV